MSSHPLLKPALYSEAGTSALPDHPALVGGRCVCGHIFFPMQTYGCEKCGRHGGDLSPVTLSGRGTLLASATVHMHMGKGRQAPFLVGSIELDDGPMVRTLIVESDDKLAPGDIMLTTLVPVTVGEDGECLDLRFKPQR